MDLVRSSADGSLVYTSRRLRARALRLATLLLDALAAGFVWLDGTDVAFCSTRADQGGESQACIPLLEEACHESLARHGAHQPTTGSAGEAVNKPEANPEPSPAPDSDTDAIDAGRHITEKDRYSAIAVPVLTSEGRLVGSLAVLAPKGRNWTDADFALLRELAQVFVEIGSLSEGAPNPGSGSGMDTDTQTGCGHGRLSDTATGESGKPPGEPGHPTLEPGRPTEESSAEGHGVQRTDAPKAVSEGGPQRGEIGLAGRRECALSLRASESTAGSGRAFWEEIVDLYAHISAYPPDSTQVAQRAAEAAARIPGADGAFFGYVEGAGFRISVGQGLGSHLSDVHLASEDLVLDPHLCSGEIRSFRGANVEFMRADGPKDDRGIGSALVAPMRIGEEIIGVLGLVAEEQDAFDECTTAALRIVAGAAGLAIANAHEYAASQLAVSVLIEGEERHKLLMEQVNDGFWEVDITGRTTFVNQRAADLLGYTRTELLGRDFVEFIEEPARSYVELDLLMGALTPMKRLECRLRHNDSGTVWAIITTIPLTTSDGQYDGCLSLITDITHQRLAEERLRHSEATFQALFTNATVGIMRASLDGWIVAVNPSLEGFTGHSAAEMLSWGLADITAPEDRIRERSLFADLVSGTRESYQLEKRFRASDGGLVWARVSMSLLRSSDGAPESVLGVVEDVTARKRSEALLMRHQALWDHLLGGYQREASSSEAPSAGESSPGEHSPEDHAPGGDPAGGLREVAYRIGLRPEVTIESVDAGVADILGYTADDFTNSLDLALRIVHPQDRSNLIYWFASLAAAQAPQVIRWIHRDGHVVWVEHHNRFVFAPDGRVQALEGTARDVTAQRHGTSAVPQAALPAMVRRGTEDAEPRAEDPMCSGLASPEWPDTGLGAPEGAESGLERDASWRDADPRANRADETGTGIDVDACLLAFYSGASADDDGIDADGGRPPRGIEPASTRGGVDCGGLAARQGSKSGAQVPDALLPNDNDCEAPIPYAFGWDGPILSSTASRHLAAVLDASMDAMIGMTPAGWITSWNAGAEHSFGYTAAEAIGQPFRNLVPPECHDELAASLAAVGRGHLVPGYDTVRVRKGGGRLLVTETLAPVLDDLGRVVSVVCSVRDDSEQKETEWQLQQYRRIAEAMRDTVLVLDADGVICDANEAAVTEFGYARGDLCGKCVLLLRAPESGQSPFWLRATDGPITYEVTGRRKDGSTVPIEVTVSVVDRDGERMYIGIGRNIAERKAFEDQLAHQVLHDRLTDLPNRALFENRLTHALTKTIRRKNRVAVLFLDVDRFEVVNNSLGHAAGDELLLAVSARLRASLRIEDTVARFGGDEFTILLENIPDEGDVTRLAQHILRRLRTPFQVHGQDVYITASIGISLGGGPQVASDELLRNADTAMHQAKARGKDGYVLYQPHLGIEAAERLRFETELHHAIQRGQFEVYYQPIILTDTKRIIGVEALARWQHPRYGLMPPDEFIPLQEQIGLIEPFTMWVLREAMTECLKWHTEGYHLSVAVNLSPYNLHVPGFADRVSALLAEIGLPAFALKLEVTETAVMMDPTSALLVLGQLSEVGIRLSMDDFGTGYSSLSYIKQLPVHEIKIDKSFVIGLDERDDDDTAIVRATIDLAHNLHKKVVAEGVESGNVWDLLSLLGCDAAQGYHMARPMPGRELREWLKTSPWSLGDTATRAEGGEP